MGYSQAAVTVQIKKLEEELGTQLFDRIGKHIKLTEHGMQFMDHGMKVMKAAEDASTFVHKEETPRRETAHRFHSVTVDGRAASGPAGIQNPCAHR